MYTEAGYTELKLPTAADMWIFTNFSIDIKNCWHIWLEDAYYFFTRLYPSSGRGFSARAHCDTRQNLPQHSPHCLWLSAPHGETLLPQGPNRGLNLVEQALP